jgi:hypothetical protein
MRYYCPEAPTRLMWRFDAHRNKTSVPDTHLRATQPTTKEEMGTQIWLFLPQHEGQPGGSVGQGEASSPMGREPASWNPETLSSLSASATKWRKRDCSSSLPPGTGVRQPTHVTLADKLNVSSQ